MSPPPREGRVSPEATVETMSFGTPTGRSRIACAAMEEFPEPPTAAAPRRRPPPGRGAASGPPPRPLRRGGGVAGAAAGGGARQASLAVQAGEHGRGAAAHGLHRLA